MKFIKNYLVPTLMIAGFGITAHARGLDSNQASKTPRVRMGTLPTPVVGAYPNDPIDGNLGTHNYEGAMSSDERRGILFTCRGGFIDMAHLRKAADWTAWIAVQVEKHLREGKTYFAFYEKEPSLYKMWFHWPEGMTDAEKAAAIPEISVRVAQLVGHYTVTWHEILTWFGYTAMPIGNEKSSAFSYEDNYSNYLGTEMAVRAIRDPNLDYNHGVTENLKSFFASAGITSAKVAKEAMYSVKKKWWNPNAPWPDNRFMMKRNLDIGLTDGDIDPFVISGYKDCASTDPIPLPLPDMKNINGRDFSKFLEMQIEPKVNKFTNKLFPGERNPPAVISPELHYGKIMDLILVQAKKQLGPSVDTP